MSAPLVQWQFLQIKKAQKNSIPTPCLLQSCTQIGSKMLIYGGCSYHGDPMSQLFVYDTVTFQWSAPNNASDFQEDHPGTRYGHTATLVDMHPPRILVYGGMIGLTTFEFDSPEIADNDSPASDNDASFMARQFMNQRRKGKNKNLAEEADNGVFFLELNSDSWTWSKPLISHKTGLVPQARAEHSASKIGTNAIAYFGGWTDKPTNDLWVLDYVALEWSRPAVSGIEPRPRYRHTSEVRCDMIYIYI
jgi:hypothetical protein